MREGLLSYILLLFLYHHIQRSFALYSTPLQGSTPPLITASGGNESLSTAGPWDYCTPRTTNEPDQSTTQYWGEHFGGDCKALGSSSSIGASQCTVWHIDVMIVIRQDGADQTIALIKNFLTSIISSCTMDSVINFYYPLAPSTWSHYGSYGEEPLDKCTGVPVNTPFNIIVNQTIGDYFQAHNQEHEVHKMFENHANCAKKTPKNPSSGGVLFFFTNILCTRMCDQLNDLVVEQEQITTTLSDLGYLFKIFYLEDFYNASTCTVLSYFTNCKGNSEINVAGTAAERKLSDFKDQFQICKSILPTSTSGDGGWKPDTGFYFMVVGIPCFLITLVMLAVVIFCYKRWTHIQKFKRRLHPERFKDHHDTLEARERMHSHIPANFAAMNNYLDLKKLAEEYKKDEWEVEPKNLVIFENENLGHGAFANVLKGSLIGKIPLLTINASLKLTVENNENGHCEVAVKRLPAHADDENRADFFHEIAFMKRLGYHVHVISMLGCISCPMDPMIIVELCHYGDLLRFIRQNRQHVLDNPNEDCPVDADMCIRVKDLVSIAWQISDGMVRRHLREEVLSQTYLSSKGFIHRDLAARNVLITKSLVAKISDFGLCRYVDQSLYTSKGGRLPIKWMSPESLKFYEFSEKSDVWSFGVTLFELFSMGEAPFPTVQPLEMIDHLEKGNRMEQPIRCPNEVYELIETCWKFEAPSRPTFSECRARLTLMLNMDDEQYGYLDISGRQFRNPNRNPLESPLSAALSLRQSNEKTITDSELERDKVEQAAQEIIKILHAHEENKRAVLEALDSQCSLQKLADIVEKPMENSNNDSAPSASLKEDECG